MSLNKKGEMLEIARIISRDLRRNSTKTEQKLWKALRGRKFVNKKFRRQHAIFHDIKGKETFFVADFYTHDDKLIIEIDGEIHKYKLREDKERTEILNALGIKVIRFRNEEVEENFDKVLNKIEEKLKKEY